LGALDRSPITKSSGHLRPPTSSKNYPSAVAATCPTV
jgi:hypothetical protein